MDATLVKNKDEKIAYTLTVEHRLAHSPEKVWRAVTERDLLKQWFPCDVIGKWKVGEKLKFVFPPEQAEEIPEDHLIGEVIAVDEAKLLEYSWGPHMMKYELVPDGDGCIFRLSESFDDTAWGARNAAGWEMCIENLDLVLEGAAIAKFALDAWRPKFWRYAEKFKKLVGPNGGLAADDPLIADPPAEGEK